MARELAPSIVFMDEIDAIGGSRFSEGTSADREIQRTLMELLNQMDEEQEQMTVEQEQMTVEQEQMVVEDFHSQDSRV